MRTTTPPARTTTTATTPPTTVPPTRARPQRQQTAAQPITDPQAAVNKQRRWTVALLALLLGAGIVTAKHQRPR